MSDKAIYREADEQAMIGCLLTSNGGVLDTLEVLPEHFYHFGHRMIAEAALRVYSEGKQVDALTVIKAIPSDELKKIGGHAYVLGIAHYPTLATAPLILANLDQALRLRRAQEVQTWLNKHVTPDADPDAICEGIKGRIGALESTSKTENILEHAITAIRLTLEQIEEGTREQGIEMPWRAWQRPFGGLHPGTMYVLAGRPGTGKTAMMEAMMEACMAQGHPVLVFEKDMSPKTLIERMACRMAHVPHFALRNGRINTAQSRQIAAMLDVLEKAPLHLFNPSDFTAERMCAITRKMIRQHGIKAVFLDHVQVLKVAKGRDKREGLTDASIAMRDCCTTTNTPLVVLAHLNRESVGKSGTKASRPRAEDIKEFDQLYGDCDGMALLWSEQRPEDLEPGAPLEVNLYAAKNRSGPTTEEYLSFNRPLMHFSDRE